MKKLFFTVLLTCLLMLTGSINAQEKKFSLGIQLGGGTISGVIPSQGSLFAGFSGELSSFFAKDFSLRGNIFYSQKIEILLPEDRRGRYYPYIQGISLQLVLKQNLNEFIFFEEALGPLFLQNRVFSDRKNNNTGIVFTFGAGLKISNQFSLIASSEIAETFGDNAVRYIMFYLQGRIML